MLQTQPLRTFLAALKNSNPTATNYVTLAEKELRRRGVTLFISQDWARLQTIADQYKDQGSFLMPLFDHRVWGLGIKGFWLEARTDDGSTGMTQAARLYDFRRKSLSQKINSCTLFYPEAKILDFKDSCVCTAPSASRIQGKVLYSGATWARPDHRKLGAADLLPRVSRALGHILFDQSYTFSLADPILIEKGIIKRYGYRNVEKSVNWVSDFYGIQSLVLIWMTKTYLVKDLREKCTSASRKTYESGDDFSNNDNSRRIIR